MNRIGNASAKFLYLATLIYKTEQSEIEISANSLAQAKRIAAKGGFTIVKIEKIG